jgi:hypothetical protein
LAESWVIRSGQQACRRHVANQFPEILDAQYTGELSKVPQSDPTESSLDLAQPVLGPADQLGDLPLRHPPAQTGGGDPLT